MSSESDRFLENCCDDETFLSWNSLICSMGPCRYLCLEDILSLDALRVLKALGQALLDMKGLFLPFLMSSLGDCRGVSGTRQKLDPADTIFIFEHSGEICRLGLELVDLQEVKWSEKNVSIKCYL